jgi:hypothetical protein
VKVCLSKKVVINIRFEKVTSMEVPFNPLGGGMGLRLRNGVLAMHGCAINKTMLFLYTFQGACPSMVFRHSNTSSNYSVSHFETSSFELLVLNSFKVFHKWSFKVSLANRAR